MTKTETCAAITWISGDHDYVECSPNTKVDICIAETYRGSLFSVVVPLCRKHQQHFIEKEHWVLRNANTKKKISSRR